MAVIMTSSSSMVVKLQGYEFFAECTGSAWNIARREVATGAVKYPWAMFGVSLTQAQAEAQLLEKAEATPGAVIIGRPAAEEKEPSWLDGLRFPNHAAG